MKTLPARKLLPQIIGTIITLNICTVAPAFAQRALDEVIVTAQKKDDTLQTVPMTVNAVTAETIAKYNMLDFKDIQSVTPGLAIRAQDSRTYSVAMRGVNVLTDSGFGASVAIYWNELTYDIDSAYKAMYDVGQIEVLRGPQGTLRGVTSPSGAITLVTKAPSFSEIEGTVEQTFGERDLSNSQFGVSLPLIQDKLAMRIAGIYDHNKSDGIKNVVTGQENSTQTRSGRMTLGLRATEDLEAQLVYQYLEANNSGVSSMWGCGNGNVTRCFDKYDRRSVAATDSDTEQRRRDAALRVEWNLDDYTLISVTGYRDQHNYVDRNQDVGNVIPPSATFGPLTLPNAAGTQQVKTDRYDFTQELRLSSNDADFYNWTYGLYASRVRANTLVNQTNLLSAFFVLPAPIPPILLGQYLNFPLPEGIVVNNGSEGYGFFTNHGFSWSDQWESQIGLRYQGSRATTEMSGPSTFGPKTAVNEGVTGTASTSYQITDDVRLYVAYGHSYRSGGFTTAPQAPGELTQYEPEQADSIELGFKSRLADGRVQINGDIYFQKFHDFLARTQQAVRTVDTDGAKSDVFLGYNANAEVSGGELQIDALLTDDWQAGLALSYTEAKFKDGAGPCNVYANGIVQDPAPGQLVNRCDVNGRLTGEPNWGASLNSEYTLHFGAIDTYVRGLYTFSTGRSDDSLPNSVLDTSSYGVFNLFIGARDVKKTWEVSVWAKNLFDHQQVTRYSPESTVGSIPLNVATFQTIEVPNGANPDLASGYSQIQLLPERQIGITGKYNFSL